MIKKILLVVLIVILLGIYWFFKGFVQQRFVSTEVENIEQARSVKVVAHRGASGYAPENSMAAFLLALEMKAGIIELDVHQSEDGEAIVIHDYSLDRTTNGTGLVENYTANELQEMDNGSWYGDQFSTERVPTLLQVLEKIDGKAIMLIEIKRGSGKVYADLGKRVVDVIREVNGESWCVVQAFDSHYIREVNAYAPDIETQKLIVQQLDLFPYYTDIKNQLGQPDDGIKVTAINSYYPFLTRRRVAHRHKKGYQTFVYTVNSEEDMIKMINLGVNGIITDYPDRLMQLQTKVISK
jgi:glycerophosphoryl diester phosphodiesterase